MVPPRTGTDAPRLKTAETSDLISRTDISNWNSLLNQFSIDLAPRKSPNMELTTCRSEAAWSSLRNLGKHGLHLPYPPKKTRQPSKNVRKFWIFFWLGWKDVEGGCKVW
jgi:hypothetical protein